jgi:hypothetical protein
MISPQRIVDFSMMTGRYCVVKVSIESQEAGLFNDVAAQLPLATDAKESAKQDEKTKH